MKYPNPATGPLSNANIDFNDSNDDAGQNRVSEAAIPYLSKNSAKGTTSIANIDESLGLEANQELIKLRQQYQRDKLQLLARQKQQLQQQQVEPLIESLSHFDDSQSITRLELIRRYAVLRQQVRDKVEFVGAKELATILDENKTNWTRDLANLYKKHKLLAIRRLGSNNWEYPLNQIDPIQGAIYPALEEVIGQFKQQGLSDWDILIWLNLPNVVEQDANPVLLNPKDTLEALLSDFDQREKPQHLPTLIPIELLHQGHIEQFQHQAERFLNPQVGG